jgi:hypothetical protein
MLTNNTSKNQPVSLPQWGKLSELRERVQPWSKSTTQRYRKTHWTEGIHWRYDVAGDIIFNLPLINDWVCTGGEEAHQGAIEAYLESLPSNQAKPPKRGTPKTNRVAG